MLENAILTMRSLAPEAILAIGVVAYLLAHAGILLHVRVRR